MASSPLAQLFLEAEYTALGGRRSGFRQDSPVGAHDPASRPGTSMDLGPDCPGSTSVTIFMTLGKFFDIRALVFLLVK